MLSRLSLSAGSPTFSRIAYGTWRLLDDAAAAAPEPLSRRLHECADLGMTTIDTAEIYGLYEVERVLGAAFARDRALRNRLEVVTKCGIYVPSAYHPERAVSFYNATAARLIKSTEKSLRLMGIDHIDLLLVHRPDWLTSADDTAEGINRLIKDGKIRCAGVSNYNVHQFELLNSRVEQPLATNQIEFSLLHMDPLFDGTADQCQGHRVHPMAWSPLAQGRLVRNDDAAALRVQAVMAAIAPKYNDARYDQLAYAWIMAHPSRPMPIVGSNSIERVTAAVAAAEIDLTREDWYALWTAAQGRSIP